MPKKKMMSRRFFIVSGGGLAVGFMMNACRISRITEQEWAANTKPEKFDTPTETGTPTNTATHEPTATETVPPTATDTPTPEETPKPGEEPTSTPTPSPTPYPPGPPSKLGLFITRVDPIIEQIIKQGQPAIIKTLEVDPNYVKAIKEWSPQTIVIGRIVLDQLSLDKDINGPLEDFMAKITPIATEPTRLKYIDAWEAVNEPVASNPEQMKRLAIYEAERTRRLAKLGVRSVIGNFATGHPDFPHWADFAEALQAAKENNGFLGLHEYSSPTLNFGVGKNQADGGSTNDDEGWFTLRYRKAYRNHLAPMGYGDLPLLITECGIDGMIKPRPGPSDGKGWQDFVKYWEKSGQRPDPEGVYMDQLLWYDSEMQKDNYVKGAAIFVAGASPGWDSYDIMNKKAGRMPALLQQYLSVHRRSG
jgi:hypothetical protein